MKPTEQAGHPESMSSEIVSRSFARAGLMGNPSDGYGGKAVAFSVRNFQATVTLRPTDKLRIIADARETDSAADSIDEFVGRLKNFGYYGGTRLLKAAIQQFHLFCENRHSLHDTNFSIQYETNIPRSVGLAGSSAIITAALKGLTQFYSLQISESLLASMALDAERKLLGIPAGLMDRVIQMMEGIVFMDFAPQQMRTEHDLSMGTYESLVASGCESRLFLAWADRAAEPTEVLHNRLKQRFEAGDADVCDAMQRFAELAQQCRAALKADDHDALARLIDENFDLRAAICQLPVLHQEMVKQARQAGGSAKFCGSGGAIVGTAPDENAMQAICKNLDSIGCQVIRPAIWTDRA